MTEEMDYDEGTDTGVEDLATAMVANPRRTHI